MGRSPSSNSGIARRVLAVPALAVAAAFLAWVPARAADIVAQINADDIRIGRFQRYVESLRVQSGIPGLAAAIIGNNEVIWRYA